jgi:peptidoglycan hydrolase CwlO-like protein
VITECNGEESLKSSSSESIQNPEIYYLVQLLLKNQKEADNYVHSLQKAVAGLREQVQDSRAEQAEDNAEVKRLLQELRRNKVWIPTEQI